LHNILFSQHNLKSLIYNFTREYPAGIIENNSYTERIMTVMDIVESEKITVSLTKKLRKVKPIKARMSRNEIIQNIADETGLKRVDVDLVFDCLGDLVKSHMKARGSGEFMIPKIGLKIKRVRRKATKQRKMVSPLTQQEVTIPSKPARWDIKLIALKSLKDSVQ